MSESLTFRTFVEHLVDLVNNNPTFADAPVMVAGEGTFSPASPECVSLKDIPEHNELIRSAWNPEKKIWDTKEQTVPAHKVVVFSAPSTASAI